MVYIGKTVELAMFYGAQKETFEKARLLRRSMTFAEKILWNKLRKHQLEGKLFRRQHPIDIFIVDFYCHEFKLVVEVDGEIHNKPEKKALDQGRTHELERYGITVLRFTNDEVFNELDWVLDSIKGTILDLSTNS